MTNVSAALFYTKSYLRISEHCADLVTQRGSHQSVLWIPHWGCDSQTPMYYTSSMCLVSFHQVLHRSFEKALETTIQYFIILLRIYIQTTVLILNLVSQFLITILKRLGGYLCGMKTSQALNEAEFTFFVSFCFFVLLFLQRLGNVCLWFFNSSYIIPCSQLQSLVMYYKDLNHKSMVIFSNFNKSCVDLVFYQFGF